MPELPPGPWREQRLRPDGGTSERHNVRTWPCGGEVGSWGDSTWLRTPYTLAGGGSAVVEEEARGEGRGRDMPDLDPRLLPSFSGVCPPAWLVPGPQEIE